MIVFPVGSPFVAGYGYNSLGFAQSNPYKRRVSTLDRKYASSTNRARWASLMHLSSSVSRMQHLDTTMASLAHLTAAPPAALYNPLEHGRSLAKEVKNGILYKSGPVRVRILGTGKCCVGTVNPTT